jgi:hypothetical protein
MMRRGSSLLLPLVLFALVVSAEVRWPSANAANGARPSLAGQQAQIDKLNARTFNGQVGIVSTSIFESCVVDERGQECPTGALHVVYSLPPGTSTDIGGAINHGFTVDYEGGYTAGFQLRSLPSASVGDPAIEITVTCSGAAWCPDPVTLPPLDRIRPTTQAWSAVRVWAYLLTDGMVKLTIADDALLSDVSAIRSFVSESDGKIASADVQPYSAGATSVQVDVSYMNNGPYGTNYLISLEDCSSHIEPPSFQYHWKEPIPFDIATISFELASEAGFTAGDSCVVYLRGGARSREYDAASFVLPGPS